MKSLKFLPIVVDVKLILRGRYKQTIRIEIMKNVKSLCNNLRIVKSPQTSPYNKYLFIAN